MLRVRHWGTLAGLVAGLAGKKKVLGVAVLKGGEFLKKEVAGLLEECGCGELQNWELDLDHHFGGYAKRSRELEGFLADLGGYNPGMPMEATYMGRLFYGVVHRAKLGLFTPGCNVLVVHTGGWGGE